MDQLSTKTDSSNTTDDSSESEHLSSPPSKRRCQSPNTELSLPEQLKSMLVPVMSDNAGESKEECRSCGKQESFLRTFNCPSSHCFCLNCIYKWTKTHIQTKTPPICLATGCDFLLRSEDLADLPISLKDHEVLLQLIAIHVDQNIPLNNVRSRCDKCCLYVDQQIFFVHSQECPGRSSTIPCEICFCPISIEDYEQHMLMCKNDDNEVLCQFLVKHLKNPAIEEKLIKMFISSWQRKRRGTIDIYEIIEELNQTDGCTKELCDTCKKSTPFSEFCFINCGGNHSLCLTCYQQHIKSQMDRNSILTCHRCGYHLQDRDILEVRSFTAEESLVYREYQEKKILESYQILYGTEDTLNIDITMQRATETTASARDDEVGPRCESCLKQHSYNNIFVLHCTCKICYNCFATEVDRQQRTKNQILTCPFCRCTMKPNDLSNLRLSLTEIQAVQLYQQGKLFESEHAAHFKRQVSNTTAANDEDDDDFDMSFLNQQQCLPQYWTLPMMMNFSRHTLDPQSTEYKFVADEFNKSWKSAGHHNPVQAPMTRPSPSLRIRSSTRATSHRSSSGSKVSSPAVQAPLGMPPLQSGHPSLHQQPASMVSQAQVSVHGFSLPGPSLPPPPQLQPIGMASPLTRVFNNTTVPGVLQPVPYLPNPTLASMNNTNISSLSAPVMSNTPNLNALFLPNVSNSLIQPTSSTIPSYSNPGLNPFINNTLPSPFPQNAFHHGPITHQLAPHSSSPLLPLSLPPTVAVAPMNTTRTIIQIERIQNQRWYKQYAAHECEFRLKLGKQTEKWLFHGCDERSSKNIEVECFNRSFAGQHAAAYGQGCYFARDSVYSHNFALPDRNGNRRMFLARVLVGKTIQGNSSMRVPPQGYDTTGDGQSIFVTYHDSQAYAEYLITYT